MNSGRVGNLNTATQCPPWSLLLHSGKRVSVRAFLQRQFFIVQRCALIALLGMVLWAIASSPAAAADYNKEILLGADFSNRVLTDSSFTKANLRGSDFNHADLQGVSFFGANLEGANLEGANLRNATLDTARLSQANLTDAVLEGAFAFNTKFDGAIIDGTDFTDVELRPDVLKVLCKVAQGKNSVTGRETRETLYCP